MKRTVAFLTMLTLMLTTLLGGFSAIAVSDMKGHWAEELVEKWVDAGTIGGYPDGTFRPQNPISRAEFAALLSRILPEDTEEGTESVQFADVSENDWFYADVMRLAGLGIAAPAERFYPARSITREEAMTMIGRTYSIASEDHGALEVFSDRETISDYALSFVAALVAEGKIGGYPDGTLRPRAKITRAESVKLLDPFVIVPDLSTLPGIMKQLYAGVKAELPNVFNTEITSENSEYYLGVPNMEFEEALASESMIGSQAHSICLVRVREGDDAKAIAEQIRTSVNPRKWICVGVERDEVITAVRGDLILLVVDSFAPKAFETSFLSLDLDDGLNEAALKPDANGYLFAGGQYINDIGSMKEASVEKFAEKINAITEQYLKDSENIFYAVIPSKNYYINHRLPEAFDYDGMNRILQKQITGAVGINLYPYLGFDDYLKTDFHWKQESLQKVVDRLGQSLGFEIDLSQFETNTYDSFTGQYGYGKPDFLKETLTYLTNDATDTAVVENYQDAEFKKVYNLDKLKTTSAYDAFLSGPTPLITIKNEKSTSDKELIIFRDSFSSSLAPLLIDAYKEITLIDIRYVMSSKLGEFVDFHGQDVLFLYNDQIINNSDMLK